MQFTSSPVYANDMLSITSNGVRLKKPCSIGSLTFKKIMLCKKSKLIYNDLFMFDFISYSLKISSLLHSIITVTTSFSSLSKTNELENENVKR